MKKFDLGAIAILDAMGFKGIWARQSPTAVLERLKALRRKALKLQGADHSGVLLKDGGLRLRVRCMSDTIVVTVVVKGPKAPRRGLYRAMLSASLVAGTIVYDAAHGDLPLLFRGCLAAGPLREEADFLIGPAVDEAAEGFERADGVFFWLAQSALDISREYADTFVDRLEPAIMLPYCVPMNDGSSFQTQAFGFFGLTQSTDARTRTRNALLNAFGQGDLPPGVERKRRNTSALLERVGDLAETEEWKQVPFVLRRPDWEDLSPDQKATMLIRFGTHWAKEE